MSDNNDSYQRATTEFPRGLVFDKVGDLLQYVGEHLPANLRFEETRYRELRHTEEGRLENLAGTGSFTYSGTISKSNDPRVFDSFTTEPVRYGEDDVARTHGLGFQVIPGYGISEHSKEVVQLWDDTRRVIGKYFDEHQLE
jgi:hypothetical protein